MEIYTTQTTMNTESTSNDSGSGSGSGRAGCPVAESVFYSKEGIMVKVLGVSPNILLESSVDRPLPSVDMHRKIKPMSGNLNDITDLLVKAGDDPSDRNNGQCQYCCSNLVTIFINDICEYRTICPKC